MGYSHKELRAYAANPLHASLTRWQQNPVSWRAIVERAAYEINEVRWHFDGMQQPTNAEALERTERAIADMKRVAEELRARIGEGNP
jgi:hypothetical protein